MPIHSLKSRRHVKEFAKKHNLDVFNPSKKKKINSHFRTINSIVLIVLLSAVIAAYNLPAVEWMPILQLLFAFYWLLNLGVAIPTEIRKICNFK